MYRLNQPKEENTFFCLIPFSLYDLTLNFCIFLFQLNLSKSPIHLKLIVIQSHIYYLKFGSFPLIPSFFYFKKYLDLCFVSVSWLLLKTPLTSTMCVCDRECILRERERECVCVFKSFVGLNFLVCHHQSNCRPDNTPYPLPPELIWRTSYNTIDR